MTENKIAIIQKSLQPVANEALTLKVKSHGDMLVATDLLSKLNQINDRAEEEKQKVLKPLNEARTAEIKRWRPIIGFYEEAIKHIRSEMTTYQSKEANKQRAREEAVADKLSKGEIDLDQAMSKIEKIKTIDKKVATDAGSVQFRATKKYEVMDMSLIFTKVTTDRHGKAIVTIDNDLLAKYLIPNDKAITEDMKNGIEIPGVRYYTEQTPVNYR